MPSLHVIAAVTEQELITLYIQIETFKSDDFRGFLPDVIDKMKKRAEEYDTEFVLFYDNAAVHKTLKIKEEFMHN